MKALADVSTMPLWPMWVWPLLAALLLLVLGIRAHRYTKRRDEAIDLWPVDLEEPVNLWPVCSTTGCHYKARTIVQSFTGPTRVCRGCADEGIAHGWFTAA